MSKKNNKRKKQKMMKMKKKIQTILNMNFCLDKNIKHLKKEMALVYFMKVYMNKNHRVKWQVFFIYSEKWCLENGVLTKD